ncbi:MAG: hypothetical protein COW88_02060 [Candidatus Lloydbacteria bacterium CG22_combo_CG10-13_8_21_14_all_47_15]|uniref:Prepilin-type N-terminal cleavage/methylation domain-containing protein n=1 Tax=Candidatus Lloydbacteria bacterium CG22_combo_CG10-13_8_21_14_all_47_15 TaxID=1974635 RepID=A0A2H0CUG0_9BACT|nr:MAG: hypothetical protein COW88_02060 [Candidatus Lloydbacteria bacterium CG22_combo_CG10-13_8_21_14_all_47_15]
MRNRTAQQGFGLIEIVIGSAIISSALLGIVFAGGTYERVSREVRETIKVSFLADEGVEAMRSIRDDDWSVFASLAVGTPYYLVFSGGQWTATATPDTIDSMFTRTVTLYNVSRDSATNKISTSSGGTYIDAETREVRASVSFERAATTTTREVRAYFSNIFE